MVFFHFPIDFMVSGSRDFRMLRIVWQTNGIGYGSDLNKEVFRCFRIRFIQCNGSAERHRHFPVILNEPETVRRIG